MIDVSPSAIFAYALARELLQGVRGAGCCTRWATRSPSCLPQPAGLERLAAGDPFSVRHQEERADRALRQRRRRVAARRGTRKGERARLRIGRWASSPRPSPTACTTSPTTPAGSVGDSADSEFAVESTNDGPRPLPDRDPAVVGSNGYRPRAWKWFLAQLAAETGPRSPSSLKWNKIEHRLFSYITMNWRGRARHDHLIASTTTQTTHRPSRLRPRLVPRQDHRPPNGTTAPALARNGTTPSEHAT